MDWIWNLSVCQHLSHSRSSIEQLNNQNEAGVSGAWWVGLKPRLNLRCKGVLPPHGDPRLQRKHLPNQQHNAHHVSTLEKVAAPLDGGHACRYCNEDSTEEPRESLENDTISFPSPHFSLLFTYWIGGSVTSVLPWHKLPGPRSSLSSWVHHEGTVVV